MAIKYVVLNRSDDSFWGYAHTLNSIDSNLQYAIDYNIAKDPESVDKSYYVALKSTASKSILDTLRITENNNAQSGGSITYILKTTSFNANNGDNLLVDTSLGVITCTLPLSPNIGDFITFVDASVNTNTFANNNLIITRNGKNIMGLAEDLTINIGKVSFSLFYNGIDWRLI